MDNKEEYHDPDYPEASVKVKTETETASEEEKIEKIKNIICREFNNELVQRENEIMLIDQRMTSARRLLHRLRYSLVNSYYQDQRLQLTAGQIDDEVSAQSHEPRARAETSQLLRGQRRIHPSVRKLLGKETVDLHEILKSREPRNKARKDYSAMIQTRNYTIAADKTRSLRPDVDEEPSTSRPKKVPRHIEPKVEPLLTVDEVTRNKMKHRFRIVIGNTSKYAPGASRADRSTHKWLLYVRGPAARPDLSAVVTAVTVHLHHSYAPHHTVHLDSPPFVVSRRGWGEFGARVELHFAQPQRNPPALLQHALKLDRHYTGLQTLGAETVVDVWLYSTPEMLEYEFKEDEQTDIQAEPEVKEEMPQPTENWMDFFTSQPKELDVDEMFIKPKKEPELPEEIFTDDIKTEIDDIENVISSNCIDKEINGNHEQETLPEELINQSPKKRIMKYMDPTTGKIYYLEMDRTLDLSKVQEIVINSKGNVKTAKISPLKTNGLKSVRKTKGGVSLLKPEVKNLLKTDSIKKENQKLKSYAHIENDHCYLGYSWTNLSDSVLPDNKYEESLYHCLCLAVERINSVRGSINYLLKKIPIICDNANDPDFVKYFPFVVGSDEKYWKMDFAKRRNIEWSRSKLINTILNNHLRTSESIWRTKQILMYSRLHGYQPVRPQTASTQPETDEWSSWNAERTTETKHLCDTVTPLSKFNIDEFSTECAEGVDSDEEVDVVSDASGSVRKEVLSDTSSLTVLPVESDDDRLRFLFVEKKCADIGIELRNEDVGHGCSYSAVHAVILSATRCFAEELLRSALAAQLTEEYGGARPPVWTGSWRGAVRLRHAALAARGARAPLSRALLGVPDRQPHPNKYSTGAIDTDNKTFCYDLGVE